MKILCIVAFTYILLSIIHGSGDGPQVNIMDFLGITKKRTKTNKQTHTHTQKKGYQEDQK